MKEQAAPRDDLDRRIDAALRRRFTPPASLEDLPARALSGSTRRARRARLLLPAAAAALLGLGLWWLGRARDSTSPVGERSAAIPPALESEPAVCRLVGPLEERRGEPREVHSPDLVRLYRDMDACQRKSAAVACSEDDRLAERLRATYGQAVELSPGAASLLHGPFASAEWPTGTIWTSTSDDLTAVLVAEHGSTLSCCVRMRLAEDSGLRVFTWPVGELVLTEITPLEEPRLLQYFE